MEQEGAVQARQRRRCRPVFRAALMVCTTALLTPIAWHLLRARGSTVLVLAGGGGKGAWAVGVLQGLCQLKDYRNAWTAISGTSIGALNAGVLAQFSPRHQCTHGVAALQAYWSSINSSADVFAASSVPGRWDGWGKRGSCLDARNALAAGYGFWRYGGFCDPSPGAENYKRFVNATKIHSSGTRLSVVASSMTAGGPKVFDQKSPDIIDACMASGSIAPLVYPKAIKDDVFVDGGLFHNTPLLSALGPKVSRAIVIELSPLDELPKLKQNASGPKTESGARLVDGFKVLEYYLQVVYASIADRRELMDACEFYPHVSIEAVVPDVAVGSIIDFTPEGIEAKRQAGLKFVQDGMGPKDVCEVLGFSKMHRFMRAVFGFDPLGGLLRSVPGGLTLASWHRPVHADGAGLATFFALLCTFWLGRQSALPQRGKMVGERSANFDAAAYGHWQRYAESPGLVRESTAFAAEAVSTDSGSGTLGSELRKHAMTASRGQVQRRMNVSLHSGPLQQVADAGLSSGASSSSAIGKQRRNPKKPAGSPSPSPFSPHEGIHRSRTSPSLRSQAAQHHQHHRSSDAPEFTQAAGSSSDVFDAGHSGLPMRAGNSSGLSPAKATRPPPLTSRNATSPMGSHTPRVPKRTPRHSPRSPPLMFSSLATAPPTTARGANARVQVDRRRYGGPQAQDMQEVRRGSSPGPSLHSDGGAGFCDALSISLKRIGGLDKDSPALISAMRNETAVESKSEGLAASPGVHQSGATTPTESVEAAALKARAVDGKDGSRIMRLIGKRSVLNHGASVAVDVLQQQRRKPETNRAFQRLQPHRHQTQHRLLPLHLPQHGSRTSELTTTLASSRALASSPLPGAQPSAPASTGGASAARTPRVPTIHLEAAKPKPASSDSQASTVVATAKSGDGTFAKLAPAPLPSSLSALQMSAGALRAPEADEEAADTTCQRAKDHTAGLQGVEVLVGPGEDLVPVCNISLISVEEEASPACPEADQAVIDCGRQADTEAESSDNIAAEAELSAQDKNPDETPDDTRSDLVTGDAVEQAQTSPPEGDITPRNPEPTVIWAGCPPSAQKAAPGEAWSWPGAAAEEENIPPEPSERQEEKVDGLQIWPGRPSTADVVLLNEAGSVILPHTWRYVLPSQGRGLQKALIVAADDGYIAKMCSEEPTCKEQQMSSSSIGENPSSSDAVAAGVDTLTENKARTSSEVQAEETEVASLLAKIDHKALQAMAFQLDTASKRALVSKLMEAYVSRAQSVPQLDMAMQSERRACSALRVVLEGLHKHNSLLQQQLAWISQGSHCPPNAPDADADPMDLCGSGAAA